MDDGGHTFVLEKDQDFLDELSEYLDILGNATRLRILKSIERTPKDIRTLSREIETSYENTKKHIDKLLLAGVIRRDAGTGAPTSKGVHPVWKYSVIPGGLEVIIQNLSIFSNLSGTSPDRSLSERIEVLIDQVEEEFEHPSPVLVLIGGPLDGSIFPLHEAMIPIGRVDPVASGPLDARKQIVLPNEYSAVTRVSRPHCRIIQMGGIWQIEDCGSTGGTFLNTTHRLLLHERTQLRNGDVIDLGKGIQGARFVFRTILKEDST
ncbi:MAG: FHA domain-containing protein [Methanocalculus sp.]|uniref:FHA domain-containing protein n=1 Tax=Methanocalculus sp. TaxID=2004547 RepID=UPI00271DDD5B|nr:FHA domain-containing protein [Methanocalculus sp.]MDO9539981.1 FHA domain-containing protein [Methanocalculus sp.]